MTPKDIFSLALRIIGVWTLVQAIGAIAQIVAIVSAGQGFEQVMVSIGYSVIAWSVCAVFILLFAPTIASWFYRDGASEGIQQSQTLSVSDIYQISARLFGMYCWFKVIEPLTHLFRLLLVPSFWSIRWQDVMDSLYLGPAIVYLLGGALLIFGSERISNVLVGSHRNRTHGDGA